MYTLLFIIGGFSFFEKKAQATHLRAGEIVVLRENCTSLTFTINVTIFTDLGSTVLFGDGILNFGDGQTITSPTINNQTRIDLGDEVGIVHFQQHHTYAGPGRYLISYREANRNANLLNMFNSVETQFYIETVINIDPILGCNNTPLLLVPPIDHACVGVTWIHNPGAYDLDGDSLSFELVTPKQNKNYFVTDYYPPNSRKFYETVGLDYNHANEQKNAPPTFSINSKTGTVTWDSPGAEGEYNIAFLVKEWRKIENTWVLLGYVTRDMQIILETCDNKRPELEIPNDICVEAGTVITEDIFGIDFDQDNVKIEAFSSVFQLLSSPATYTPNPPIFQHTIAQKAKQTFTWATQCNHVKEQPYQIVFKITDQPDEGKTLASFKTWNITVVAPAPTWKQVKFSSTPHTTELTWNNYTCTNAEKMQIWRRKGIYNASPSPCVVGMPSTWGFSKIAEIPIGTTSFTDNNKNEGLTPGLTYCYRMVAEFPKPTGGKSYVSTAQCLTVKADLPIPIQATVDITDSSKGQITIAWKPPFEATTQFPPPYTFKIYRAEGFTGTVQEKKIHSGELSELTFVDGGLNTQEKVYNYRIVAFDNTGTKVGSSKTASSVWLTPQTKLNQITLNWEANVPWDNKSQSYPWHLIYRRLASEPENQMVLIDSVDVNKVSFKYIDRGQFNNIPLSINQKYCYRIMTRGGYSNKNIEEPLKNFSQIICTRPNNKEKPCTPSFSPNLQNIPCNEYIASTPCNQSIFSNLITWEFPDDNTICEEDILSYNIYLALHKGDKFVLHKKNHKDTEFRDKNLPSFARCYKVSAINQAGNESELSDSICFDNCPNYELPNVFTPNGDLCNQTFGAYSNRIALDEQGNTPCGKIDENQLKTKCARFVNKIEFTLVNKWGKPVYNYQSGGENSIFIDWNGQDDFGRDLSSGVYFYSIKILFDVVDPKKREKTIKGWVHLIR